MKNTNENPILIGRQTSQIEKKMLEFIKEKCSTSSIEFMSEIEKEYLQINGCEFKPDEHSLSQVKSNSLNLIIEPMFCRHSNNECMIFHLNIGWNNEGIRFFSYNMHKPESESQEKEITLNILKFIKQITDESENLKSIINS